MEPVVLSSISESEVSFNESHSSQSYEPFKLTVTKVVFIVFASLVSLTTVVANVTLIILVCVDATLRRLSNYYIISLACADLIVGIFVIPMFSLYNVLGRWPLGSLICELWITTDFTIVSVSILGICMISLDRYWAITQPLRHLRTQRKKRALLYVAGIWIVPGLCWIPAVVAHRIILGSFADDSTCIYLPSFTYVMVSTLIIYVIPMTSLVFLYSRILAAVRRNFAEIVQVTESTTEELVDPTYARKIFCCCKEIFTKESTLAENVHGSIQTISYSLSFPSSLDTPPSTSTAPSVSLPPSVSFAPNVERNKDTHVIAPSTLLSVSDITPSTRSLSHAPDARSTTLSRSSKHQRGLRKANAYSDGLRAARVNRQLLARHRLHERTAKTLGIIVAVFLLCWIPFIVLFPINSYCSCIPIRLYDVAYWMAYANSTMNPFLYGFNKDFRKAFRSLVCGKKPPRDISSLQS